MFSPVWNPHWSGIEESFIIIFIVYGPVKEFKAADEIYKNLSLVSLIVEEVILN